MASQPPRIFSTDRKLAKKTRAAAIFRSARETPFLAGIMAEDMHERLSFVRHSPSDILIEGFGSFLLLDGFCDAEPAISIEIARDFGEPMPYLSQTYDLVISINSLDTVNDLPGALIQMRELLQPGGIAMASFIGGSSLGRLRRAIFEAEPDRPAARLHPMIDPRSCPQLLSRAGWNDPVVDSYALTVRYSSLGKLVADLRAHAMTNVLASLAPPLSRPASKRAADAFMAQADDDGKVSETFEIITLTGRSRSS